MTEFFKWVCDHNRPTWVFVCVLSSIAAFAVSVMAITIISLAHGYWLVPVVIFLVVPLLLLAREYQREGRK